MTTSVRDLIYFDFDKAASLWSQLAGGLRSELSVTEETKGDGRIGIKFGLPKIVESSAEIKRTKGAATLEKKALHHDLLNYLEAALIERHLLTNLSKNWDCDGRTVEQVNDVLRDRPYILGEGWASIESYARLLQVIDSYDALSGFVHTASIQSVKNTPGYRALHDGLNLLKERVKTTKDREQRSKLHAQTKDLEDKISAVDKNPNQLDAWLKEGIVDWIKVFSPNRVTLRIVPFEDLREFQIVCNLSPEHFVDQNIDHLLYGYGNFPSVKLGVFGLITARPPMDEKEVNQKRFSPSISSTDPADMRHAFRGLFLAVDEIELVSRPFRHPEIAVHPIAVFRHFTA